MQTMRPDGRTRDDWAAGEGWRQPPAGGERVHLAWSGNPWDLAGLGLVNFLLSLVTLGIYSFWGKTEVRKRLWSGVRLQGEPLAYTGTGMELFLGFLFALGVVVLPIFLLSLTVAIVFGPESPANNAVGLIVYIAIFLLMGIAIYRARRYRLNRTAWRGIRGGMSGVPSNFAGLWIGTAIAIPFTFGWIVPYRANLLQHRLTTETTFGDKSFGYAGSSSPLYGPYAAMWVGGLVIYLLVFGLITFATLGPAQDAIAAGRKFEPAPGLVATFVAIGAAGWIGWSVIRAWYESTRFNLFARYTSFDQARFNLRTTTGGLIGLFLSNLAIYLLSLGILAPVVQARSLKYFIDRLTIDGTIDFAAIAQGRYAPGRGGEGLAQAFDIDAF